MGRQYHKVCGERESSNGESLGEVLQAAGMEAEGERVEHNAAVKIR